MALSAEQQVIVNHPIDRHAVVLAVAGSGKSTTMAERIAYLVEAKRVEPNHIIAVMFNKAAALELGARLVNRLGKRNAPASMTYHALGTLTLNRLIREGKAEPWDFVANPSIAQRFATGVIENVCLKYGHKYPRIVADVFLSFIDRVKSDLRTPAEVWADGEFDAKYQWFVPMFAQYEQARARAKKRFFSDLIYDPVVLMRQDPDAARVAADRYAHIIVDEYQDICESQQSLVRFNAGQKARVMVVGDDDQTIYTWRGAKPSYILRDFQRDFPDSTVYKLTRTWRYGHALSVAANHVITGNADRAPKLCISGDKAPSTELYLEWDHGNGKKLVETVGVWLASGGTLKDIAVLVRTYSKSGASQFALLQAGIPFRLEGGDEASVLANKWVVSLLGWLKLAAGQFAERPYAGDPDFGSIKDMRAVLDCPPLGLSWDSSCQLAIEVLKQPEGIDGFAKFSSTLAVTSGELATRVSRLGVLWRKCRSLSSKARSLNPSELLGYLAEELDIKRSIYKHAKSVDDASDQWELVEAFIAYVQSRNGTLPEFLKHIADLQTFTEKAKESTNAVHMTSVHRSKGLEWPCVIMIGLAQGAFPHKPKRKLEGDKADRHLEDERRLFYVAMTRAKKALYLFSPPDAMLHQWLRAGKRGYPNDLKADGSSASQFLYESNLYLSKTIPGMLSKPLAIKAADPEVYNEYLLTLGCSYQVEKLNIPITM